MKCFHLENTYHVIKLSCDKSHRSYDSQGSEKLWWILTFCLWRYFNLWVPLKNTANRPQSQDILVFKIERTHHVVTIGEHFVRYLENPISVSEWDAKKQSLEHQSHQFTLDILWQSIKIFQLLCGHIYLFGKWVTFAATSFYYLQ